MARLPKPIDRMRACEFGRYFPNERACRIYLIARRWPDGVHCPRCGNPKVYALASGNHWQCHKCAKNGYRFSHLAGTIFEDTNKPLGDWFRVIHLMRTGKDGMSTLEIHRIMGFGAYTTTLNMCERIHAALVTHNKAKLGGTVEVASVARTSRQ